jgi:hypothetical protein
LSNVKTKTWPARNIFTNAFVKVFQVKMGNAVKLVPKAKAETRKEEQNEVKLKINSQIIS